MAAPFHTDFQQGKSLLHGTKNQRPAHTYLPEEVWASEGWRTVCGAALKSSRDLNCNPSNKKQVAIIMAYHIQRISAAIRPTKIGSSSTWNAVFNGPQLQSVPQAIGRHHHGTQSSKDLSCNPSHKNWVAVNMEYGLQRTSNAIRPTNNRSPSSWNTIFKGPRLQSVPQKISRANPFGIRRKKSQRVPFDKK